MAANLLKLDSKLGHLTVQRKEDAIVLVLCL